MTCIRRVVGTGLAIGVVALSMPLAACGGGGDDGGALDISNVDQNENRGTAKEVPEQVIEVKDNEFAPNTITIKPGTKVIWKWTETANPHSIQLSGNTSPEQSSGTYERIFDQTGSSFAYQCGVHKAAMTGRISIE